VRDVAARRDRWAKQPQVKQTSGTLPPTQDSTQIGDRTRGHKPR